LFALLKINLFSDIVGTTSRGAGPKSLIKQVGGQGGGEGGTPRKTRGFYIGTSGAGICFNGCTTSAEQGLLCLLLVRSEKPGEEGLGTHHRFSVARRVLIDLGWAVGTRARKGSQEKSARQGRPQEVPQILRVFMKDSVNKEPG